MSTQSISEAKASPRSSRFNILIVLGLLLLPFLALYWLVPVFSDLTLGNDYPVYPIEQQLDLNHSIEKGSFPLYAPGFAGGQSASALTLGQIFHPLPHIARIMPGYWEGHALAINTALRLLSLGLCQIFVFFLMRRLGINIILSVALSFFAIYNLRMLDHFRYGASLENHTAFISLCCCICFYFLNTNKRWASLGIVMSGYLLVVGGHPQITYLGFLGAAIVTLLAPSFVRLMRPDILINKEDTLRGWTVILVLVVASAVLAAPYLSGFYFEFLASNTIRAENPYEWSLLYQDSLGGTLRSLYAPLEADVTGAFGGASLILVAAISPLLIVLRQNLPAVIWVAWGLSLITVLLCLGDATPLHRWTWEYFPLASNFRTPGRYSILLIFPLVMVLIWIAHVSAQRSVSLTASYRVSVWTVACLIALVMYLGLNLFADGLLPDSATYTPILINKLSPKDLDHSFYLGLSVLIAGLVYGLAHASKLRPVLGCLFIVFVVAQLTHSMRHGTWVEEAKPQLTLEKLNEIKSNNLVAIARPGFGMTQGSVDTQMSNSIIEPKLARLYRHVHSASDKQSMWQWLLKERNSHQAIVLSDKNIELASPFDGPEDILELVRSTYNRIDFETHTHFPSLLSTNIPYHDGWVITIDGEPAESFQANGNELAVQLPAGQHLVRFEYRSKATIGGMVASILVLICLMLYWVKTSQYKFKFLAAAVSLLVPVFFGYLWYSSLFQGDDFGTEYQWSSSDFAPLDNLAYGRMARASSLYNDQMPTYFYAGLAVDGGQKGQPFVSKISPSPNWKVDLGDVYSLERIVIHGLLPDSQNVNVFASIDDSKFQHIARVYIHKNKLDFKIPGKLGRYIAIQARGNTVLGFSEVEVFGKPYEPEEPKSTID